VLVGFRLLVEVAFFDAKNDSGDFMLVFWLAWKVAFTTGHWDVFSKRLDMFGRCRQLDLGLAGFLCCGCC
jgi:hypothetical protein